MNIIFYDRATEREYPLTACNVYRFTQLPAILETKFWGLVLAQANNILNSEGTTTGSRLFIGRSQLFDSIIDLIAPSGIRVRIHAVNPRHVRYDVVYPPPQIITAPPARVAVLYIIVNGLVLVHMRSKKSGGFIDVPGGHIEANETPYNAALRESQEEAGLETNAAMRSQIYMFYTGHGYAAFVCYLSGFPPIYGPNPLHADEINMDYDFTTFGDRAQILAGTGHAWVPIDGLKGRNHAKRHRQLAVFEALDILDP